MTLGGLARWWPAATAVGALLALAGAGQDWAVAVAVDPVLGQTETPVTGSQVGRTVTAGGLLAGAALLAGLTGTRLVRALAAASTVVAAALVGWPAARLVLNPEPVVLAALSEATGVTGGDSLVLASVGLTGWPWAVLLAVLLLLAGAAGEGLRAVRAATAPAAAERDRPAPDRERPSDWDRLNEGEDPTDDQP